MNENNEKTSSAAKPNDRERQPAQALARPTIFRVGPVTKLTNGAGRQYEDGRKYSERQ